MASSNQPERSARSTGHDEPPTVRTFIGEQPALRYQNEYLWFVFVSAMDLMLTWVILYRGGQELNWVAAAVIRAFDLWGLLAFKFALVILIVVLCEAVGRRNYRAGARLARVAVAVAAIPVVAAIVQLLLVPVAG